jgi:formylglycine-generating enzyme required for sulfatase activity
MFRLFAESQGYKTRAELDGASQTWRSNIEARKDHPVTFVTFNDALAFCSWVREVCGWCEVRLPKDLEYEYVVRGGDADRLFPWGARWEYERCNDRFWGGDKTTSSVKRFESGRAMPQDVWDLCGNVYEWLSDPAKRGFRAAAGGSFKHAAVFSGHASARAHVPEDHAADEIGFRIVIVE